jgi:parallel beta-helix repeat protein
MVSNVSRGVSSFASNIEISNNVFTAITQYAIYAATGKNNVITKNIVTNLTKNDHRGIYVLGNNETTITNNSLSNGLYGIYCVESSLTISGNIIENYSQDGIYNLMAKNTITKNVLNNNLQGMSFQGSSNCRISENVLKGKSGVPGNGIILSATSRIDYTNKENVISNNIISGYDNGIRFWGANEGNKIEGNLIKENGNGIDFKGIIENYQYYRINKNNQINKNIITENNNGMNFIDYNKDNTIGHNNIFKNSQNGIDATNENGVVAAQENYWGSDKGPNALVNPLSDGDHVTINVDFLNWLKSEEKIDTPKTPSPVISNYPITRNFQYGFLAGFDVPFVLLTVSIAVLVITKTCRKKAQI